MNEGRPVILILAFAVLLSLLFCIGQLPTPGQAAQPQPTQPPAQPTKPQIAQTWVADTTSAPAKTIDWQEADAMDGSHIFVYDCEEKALLYCSTDPRAKLYPGRNYTPPASPSCFPPGWRCSI